MSIETLSEQTQSTTLTNPPFELPVENTETELTAAKSNFPQGLELFIQLLRPYSNAELDLLLNVPQNQR